MANSGSIFGNIQEEFEKLGENVVKEAVQAPPDIAGKAMESLGVSGGKQKGQTPTTTKSGDQSAVDTLAQTKDESVKKAIARAALAELAGQPQKPKEPTVAERIEMEEKQKKEMLAKSQAQALKDQLKPMSSKKKRGDFYAVRAKQTSAERKVKRQD